jgi:hypothetical protein
MDAVGNHHPERGRIMTQVATNTFQTQESVVDDSTYDLLQALTSKLEAIEAYEQYATDPGGEIFTELVKDERDHARRLLAALRERLAKA